MNLLKLVVILQQMLNCFVNTYFFHNFRDINMPTVTPNAILTRELLPEIFEYIETYDPTAQISMLDVVIARNPRIREFMILYFNNEFTELGDVDYEMPKLNQPAYSNLYQRYRDIKSLTKDSKANLQAKRQAYKVIASSITIEELMFIENMLTHTLEDMYSTLNWVYLKDKYQTVNLSEIKPITEVVTIVDETVIS